ncbi:MAG: MerR family transcriptional regulator [Lachnospiraceae bacterium]|nr:MerR family transcriptional regulator [Lachnospiraceae bacterium]
MDEKSRLLTIGQFAALHGINKKTLMWYDEIGLFKPAAVNPENGYRCYNYHQSSLLETILLLRELNVSIKEIQAFMENRSAESLKRLLDEKIEELDREILHLKAVRKTLGNHRQNMKTLLNTNLSEIRIAEKEERCLVTVAIDPGTSYDKTVERITAETRKYQLRRLHDASYGSMIRVENLYQSRFDDYDGLFIEIPLPLPAKPDDDSLPAHGTQKAGLHIQPRGKYVRAFYRGDWENMSLKYREILNYAQKHRLTLTGFSYEKILNENVADRMEDYIVQIEIPVLL